MLRITIADDNDDAIEFENAIVHIDFVEALTESRFYYDVAKLSCFHIGKTDIDGCVDSHTRFFFNFL